MNERIRELMAQAGFDVERLIAPYPGGFPREDMLALESFAELIVRECMRMCDVAAVGYDTHNHIKEANGCCSAKEYIADHFGVEE